MDFSKQSTKLLLLLVCLAASQAGTAQSFDYEASSQEEQDNNFFTNSWSFFICKGGNKCENFLELFAMSAQDGDSESVNDTSHTEQQNELSEGEDSDDDEMSDSSSSSSSGSSSSGTLLRFTECAHIIIYLRLFIFSEDSSSSSDTESVATTSRSSDLRTCPLRSLLTNYGDDGGSFSPINTDFPEHNDTTGPVDPVFVDEESSGEAVASAADHDDLDLVPPLPGKIRTAKYIRTYYGTS